MSDLGDTVKLKKQGVYQIKNNINSKAYIGGSNDIEDRWKAHIYEASRPNTLKHSLIHKAIYKYGIENFIFSIIEETSSYKETMTQEIYWIAFYKTNVCRYGKEFGYNLTDGGDGVLGHVQSQETIEKIRTAATGKLLGENGTNVKLTTNQVLEMIKSYGTGNYTQEDLSKIYGVAPNTISRILNGKRWPHIYRSEEMQEKNLEAWTKHKTKLTEIQVLEIRSKSATGPYTQQKLADEYGVSRENISQILLRKRWNWVK